MICRDASPNAAMGTRAPADAPLTGPALLPLTLAATAGMALFYLYCLLALTLVGALILVEIALMVAAARVGVGAFVLRMIQAQGWLLTLIARSLGLRRPVEYGVPLERQAAPRLFEMIARIAGRVGVPPPGQTVLEIGPNAWVQLRGYRRGRGGATLGLGFDLLALLSETELEVVLAHEMAHARLIQRGLKGWLANGLQRMGQLAFALEQVIGTAREERRRFFTAELLARGVHILGRMERRLFAACSRQDEFAADRLAAELCGAGVCRRALLQTAIAAPRAAALSLRDRMIQAQRDESYAAWLRARLTPEGAERDDLEREALADTRPGEFDSHPGLADRLATLPEGAAPEAAAPPALDLLADADGTAMRLLAAVERVTSVEEQRESERLRREVRKRGRGEHLTPVQTLGIILGIVGIAFTVMSVSFVVEAPQALGSSVPWLVGSLAVLGLGVRLFLGSRYRERVELPAPPFAVWKAAMDPAVRGAVTDERLDALGEELKACLPPSVRGRRARARYWGDACYRALAECDYTRAVVASRFCVEADRHCLEGLLGGGVAMAYFGEAGGAEEILTHAVRRYGVGASVGWALGWAFLMLGDWPNAEPYLLDAASRRPEHPALASLLGLCQSQQTKLQEAERCFRRAAALEPDEVEHGSYLMQVLIAAGRPRDALQEVERLERFAPTDYAVMLCRVGTELHLGRSEAAAEHAAALETEHPSTKTVLHLGQAHLDAGQHLPARQYLQRVLAEGFYPRALVGLAYLAAEEKATERARALLLSSLDLTRPLGPEGEAPFELLDEVCRGLVGLAEPVHGLSAWTAVVDLPPSLTRVQRLGLLVHALSLEEAREQVRVLYRALCPGHELTDDRITPESRGPVEDRMPPGIYGCFVE